MTVAKLLIFLLFYITSAEFYYETDTRIIIVTDEIPEDGHLRFFKSASARNLHPVLLRCKKDTSEIEEALEYLNSVTHEENEVSLITPSSNYLATHDALNFAMNVAKVALTLDGNVVMAYPMEKNLSSFDTPVDSTLEKIKKALDLLRNPQENTYYPAPENLEEWKIGVSLYSKYRRILVKQKKYQYKFASVYNEKYCAFAGLTKALKNFLERLASRRPFSTLKEVCNTLAENEALAYELRVVKDFEGHLFKRVESQIDGLILIKDPKTKDSATHLHSNSYEFSPFTFAEDGKMPYLMANFASGDIIAPAKGHFEYYDSKIENITEHFNGKENIPVVHIIAIITLEGKNFEDFMKNIAGFSYPKIRTKLDILYQNTHNELDLKNLQEVIGTIQSDNRTAFPSIRAVVIDNADASAVYEKAWSFAKEEESNYTFLVHSSVHFTDQDVVQKLIQLNRKVVSPILESKNVEFNFKADNEDMALKDNLLSEPFSAQYEDMEVENITMIGLMQVPYVFGAILLRKDVVKKMDFHFDLCPLTCPNVDKVCIERRENQQCETNYFENLSSTGTRVWGMMCKNIVESGFIIFLNNENIYGDFNLSKVDNLDENQKKEHEEEEEEEQDDFVEFTSAIVRTPVPDGVAVNQDVI